jgi:hypothetical protein
MSDMYFSSDKLQQVDLSQIRMSKDISFMLHGPSCPSWFKKCQFYHEGSEDP